MGPSSISAAAPNSAAVAKEKAAAEKKEREAQLKLDIQITTFKAVRAKYPAKLGKPEFLLLLDTLDTYSINKDLAPRPRSLTGCQEKDLVRFVLDSLFAPDVDDSDGYMMEKELLAAAKRYGVNAAAIAKDLTEDFEEKETALAKAANPGGMTNAQFKKHLGKITPPAKKPAAKK
jgi:hypothetical protein